MQPQRRRDAKTRRTANIEFSSLRLGVSASSRFFQPLCNEDWPHYLDRLAAAVRGRRGERASESRLAPARALLPLLPFRPRNWIENNSSSKPPQEALSQRILGGCRGAVLGPHASVA